MRLLAKSPARIIVKSTIDIGPSIGGFVIQLSLLFSLIFIIIFFFRGEKNTSAVFFIFFVLLLNFISYYFMLHSSITRNINQIQITKEGITSIFLWNKKFYQAEEIVKAVINYTYIKGSRGSENTHIAEVLIDLKTGKTVTAFYMEKVFWKDEYDPIYTALFNTLIEFNYCTPADYEDSNQEIES